MTSLELCGGSDHARPCREPDVRRALGLVAVAEQTHALGRTPAQLGRRGLLLDGKALFLCAVDVQALPAVLLVDPYVIWLLALAVVAGAAEDADVPSTMPSPIGFAVRQFSGRVDVVQLNVSGFSAETLATASAVGVFVCVLGQKRFEQRQESNPTWPAWIVQNEMESGAGSTGEVAGTRFEDVPGHWPTGHMGVLVLVSLRFLVEPTARVDMPNATVWRFSPAAVEIVDQCLVLAELAPGVCLAGVYVRHRSYRGSSNRIGTPENGLSLGQCIAPAGLVCAGREAIRERLPTRASSLVIQAPLWDASA